MVLRSPARGTTMIVQHQSLRRRMRRIARHARRLTLVFVALFALAFVGLRSALPDLVRDRVAVALAGLGLPDARFHVASVGLRSIRLTDLELAPDLAADAAVIDFADPRDLLEGRIAAVTIDGARWTSRLDVQAIDISTPARLLDQGGGSTGDGSAPPIRLLGAVVVLTRDGEDLVTLHGDAEITAASSRASFVARSPLGAQAIDVRATRELGGFSLVSAITPADAPDATPFRLSVLVDERGDPRVTWDGSGPVPQDVATLLLPVIEPEGEVFAVSRGALQATADRAVWRLDDVSLDLDVAHARVAPLNAELEEVSATLHATGTVGEGLDVWLDPRSRVRIEHLRTPGARLEHAELTTPIHVSGDTVATSRVDPAGELRLTADVFAVGRRRSSELRFSSGELTIAAQADRPLFANGLEHDRLEARFSGTAGSVRGALRGQRVGITGGLEADLGRDGTRISVPLHVDVATLEQLESEVSFAHARFDLPLLWNDAGELRVDGRVAARTMAWKDVDIGATTGTLRVAHDRLALDWTGDATALADFRVRASIGLANGHTTVDVRVPPSPVVATDPLHRVLTLATGFEIVGRVGCEVHLEPSSPGGGRARLTLDGALVHDVEDRGRARDVGGTIVLSSVDPPVSVAADRMSFGELEMGELVRTRRGSARVRLEPSGAIHIEGAVAELGGGRLHVAPFRFHPDAPEVSVALTLEGIRMDRLVALLAQDRASASGLVDGNLGLRVRFGAEPRVVLGEGRLAARGPGLLSIPGSTGEGSEPADLEALSDGHWIQERVLAALADFRYSRLVLDVVHEGGTSKLRARVSGHGASTPQALDLNVNVDDLQALLDESLRIMPRDRRAHPPT